VIESKTRIDVPWKPREAVMVFLLAWIGAPIAIAYLLKILAPIVPQLNWVLLAFRTGDIVASFVFAVINALASLAVVAYYLSRYRVGWRAVGWRSFNPLKAVIYVALAVGFFLVTVNIVFLLVEWIFPAFNAAEPQTNDFTRPGSSLARKLSLVALVIIPPVVEETVFRGFIFPAVSKNWGMLIGAIITSLLFGLAHLQLNVSLYTIILSLILCFMYYRLRSIWPGVFVHMINNYMAFVALLHK
jgi:uncharacterized protein